MAATYQRVGSPGGLSRGQIVEYLAANPPAGDFEATVGEIREQARVTKPIDDPAEQESGEGANN